MMSDDSVARWYNDQGITLITFYLSDILKRSLIERIIIIITVIDNC